MRELLNLLDEYKEQGLEYRVIQRNIHVLENYLVRAEREMTRFSDTTETSLTVYKVFEEDGTKYRGSASALIHPGMTQADMKTVIDEMFFAAGYVKNAYYPLEDGGKAAFGEAQSDISEDNAEEVADRLISAVYAIEPRENGNISYSECFVTNSQVHIVNSNGVDITFSSGSAEIELAVHQRNADATAEVEIYESYSLANCGTEYINNRVNALFQIAAQKVHAKPTPSLSNINTILTGECLKELFGYYIQNANAANIYTKISTFAVGDDLQSDCTGDRFTLELDPFLPGSTRSVPYDDNGTPLKKTRIIENGKVISLWGDLRHSSYLAIPATGIIDNCIITGGSLSTAEMKKAPYLELLSFSDFQTDAITGDFFGEIRLGFYFDGTETVPVTSGSVSGNIKAIQSSMRLSSERAQFNNYKGPSSVMVSGVSIAGV